MSRDRRLDAERKKDITMALILRKLVTVVKHDESGVHRISDILLQGESVAYRTPCPTQAHNYLQVVGGSRAGAVHTTSAVPAVNGRGRAILTPID